MGEQPFKSFRIYNSLAPIATDSSGKDGIGYAVDGFDHAFFICSVGAGAGDSDDTVAFQISKDSDSLVDSDGSYTDITAATITSGAPSGDTDTFPLATYQIAIDLLKINLPTGMLRASATASAGGASLASAVMILHGGSGVRPNWDTDMFVDSDIVYVTADT